jgi:hypothetical protein
MTSDLNHKVVQRLAKQNILPLGIPDKLDGVKEIVEQEFGGEGFAKLGKQRSVVLIDGHLPFMRFFEHFIRSPARLQSVVRPRFR